MDYLHLKTSIWIEFSLPILCTNFANMFVVFVIAYKFNGLLKTLVIASSGIHRGFHSTIRTFLRFCFTTACMVDFDPKELAFWLTLTFHLWRSFVTIFMNMPHGAPLLRMTYTSIPAKKPRTLNYFVPQLPMCLQTLLYLKASPCHHLICLILKPRILSMPNIFFEVQLVYNLVGFNFHFSHPHFMTFGLLKTICQLHVCLRRSSPLPSPRVLHFLLSSSLMMGPVRELSLTLLLTTRGRWRCLCQ